MSTESELLPMDDTQARLESHDNTLSPDVPNREPVKRKASASEDRLSPKRIKHDDHFREATNELPRRDSLQSRRDSHGDSAGVDVDRRKLATQEEKKRGKRLFGGLLNTLSQTAGNTQHKRRLEIERRQQERIHKQSIEDGKVQEEKRARITEIRKGEQIVFDEEVMRNKHTKMLAMAQYLRTKSRPQIYYLPWKLTEEQEDAIDTQIQQAKTTIEREVGAFDARKERQTNQGRKSPVPVEATVPLNDDSASEPKAMNAPEQLSRNQEMDNQEHHDHHNDESADVLEEAEEDTVIY